MKKLHSENSQSVGTTPGVKENISIENSKSTSIITKKEYTRQELLSFWSGLGTLFPVVPRQCAKKYPAMNHKGEVQLDKEGNPKPRFTGKNPSFFDKSENPRLIKGGSYTELKDPTFAGSLEDERHGIGIYPYEGVVAIDIDRKQFDTDIDCDRAAERVLERIGKNTYCEKSPGGGYHIIVRTNNAKDYTNFSFEPGGKHLGEVIGVDRFVVTAPTKDYVSLVGNDDGHSLEVASVNDLSDLGIYSTKNKNEVPVAPAASVEEIFSLNDDDENSHYPNLSELITRKSQSVLAGETDATDRSAAFAGFVRDLYGWINFCSENSLSYSGNVDELIERAATALEIEDKVDRCLSGIDKSECIPHLVKSGSVNRALGHYQKKLEGNKSLKASRSNASTESVDKRALEVIEMDEFFYEYLSHRLKWNLMKLVPELDGTPIEVIEHYRRDFIAETGKFLGRMDFIELIQKVAKENSYHPVRDYLNQCLTEFEGSGLSTDIVRKVASKYLHTNEDLYDIYLMRFMIGAIERAFFDGSGKSSSNRNRLPEEKDYIGKVDNLPILVGPQGCGKSTFFRIMGGIFFSDSLGDNKDKDELLVLHHYWIHEYAELESIYTKKAVSSLKHFVTKMEDTFRLPYDKAASTLPRRCVFCGTTNEQEILNDPTGDRRFWVIKLNEKVDNIQLSQDIRLLWGAAMRLYLDGEPWRLTELEEELRSRSNKEFQHSDLWEESILEYASNREYVLLSEVIETKLSIPLSSQSQKEKLRVKNILKSNGWTQGKKSVDGKSKRVWLNPMKVDDNSDILEVLESLETYAQYQGMWDQTFSKKFTSEEFASKILSKASPRVKELTIPPEKRNQWEEF